MDPVGVNSTLCLYMFEIVIFGEKKKEKITAISAKMNLVDDDVDALIYFLLKANPEPNPSGRKTMQRKWLNWPWHISLSMLTT